MSCLEFELYWINTRCGWCNEKKFFWKKNLVRYSFLMVSMPSFYSLSNLKHVGLVL